MSILLYTGLGDWLDPIREKLDCVFELKEAPAERQDESLAEAELLVIGPFVANSVKTVQMVYGAEKYISIIVLVRPADLVKVKQSIQFAPFVGKNCLCIAYSEGVDLKQVFANAAQRTRQRRSFSHINKANPAASPIINTQLRVENLGIFLEQAPIGALLVDEAENIVALNKRAKVIFNTVEDKLYVLRDILPALSLQQLKMIGPNTTSEGMKAVRVKGLFLELHVSSISSEEGKLLNILLVNDITGYKKKEAALRESEALFRFMAEAMPQKVWTADEKGHRQFFNQKWIEYSGLTHEELEGWGWVNIIHPEDRELSLLKWRESIETGNDFEGEHRLLAKNGHYRWHLVRGVAHKDAQGKAGMWIGTNTDIHEHKAFAEEMESRVRERTLELEKSNSELEQFVYVTSHDLQEPMRKIRIFSDLLKGVYSQLDPESQKYLDKINATALRMSTMLKELLNFTQMSREEQFVETDLNQVVSEVMLDLELMISQKGAEVQVGHLPTIEAIPVQMHQVFYNLLNNALKFSKEEETPVVRINALYADEEKIAQHKNLNTNQFYCEIIVQDNGIGFEPAYAKQIFNIFQRLHNRTSYSGTGIGLALCKKVVANHYGEIYAESEPGKGTAFHILLPAGERLVV